MSGARRPMDVNLASGKKHWTRDEIETRKRSEASVPKPVRLVCPKWLCPEAAKLFRSYARELLDSGLPVSRLDTGSLARLCDAEALYAKTADLRDLALDKLRQGETSDASNVGSPSGDDPAEDAEQTQAEFTLWMKTMASCEKIARGAANDLGCTISSRCRMVVPKLDTEDDDPLLKLLERRNA